MIKLFATAALTFGLLVSGPAIAAETLTHNGITYEYTVAEKGGSRVITGYDLTNRRAFTLRVGKRRVEGEVDGQPVSFALRDVKPITSVAKPAEVAVR
ncbi:hypothetical protein [Sphingomonas sp. SUN039]|uniref:hypothetical protein n=1 Tax=Sphingomonas sp. SUN039 TaxID=2937787 RepID=UPI0021640B61|nr:hypothetical protein [Sphingomonas sp. SUN039]UVO54603.1 hypothetical protein M0209_10895 [Sphingomonas sp. SUN039]